MKKYIFKKVVKNILLMTVLCGMVFCLIGFYYHTTEKDIFTEGDIVVKLNTIGRDVTITLNDTEKEKIRSWITTLSSDDQTLYPNTMLPTVAVIGKKHIVGFIPDEETMVYPDMKNDRLPAMCYKAKSSDEELTRRVEDIVDGIIKEYVSDGIEKVKLDLS